MGTGYFRRRRPQGRPTPCQRAVCALLALLSAVLLPATAQGQVAGDVETAEARTSIVSGGSLISTRDMDFGRISQPALAGSVTITPSASPTCSPTAGLVRTGACQPAEFAFLRQGNNNSNAPVNIRQLNSGSILLTGPGGATMTVTNISIGTVTNLNPTTGVGPAGTLGRYRFATAVPLATFKVGGRLNVGANQAGGAYTGTLIIEVTFN